MWQHALSHGFQLFGAAREALARFGGLRIDQYGPGAECAREAFEINPTLAVGEERRFRRFEDVTTGMDIREYSSGTMIELFVETHLSSKR